MMQNTSKRRPPDHGVGLTQNHIPNLRRVTRLLCSLKTIEVFFLLCGFCIGYTVMHWAGMSQLMPHRFACLQDRTQFTIYNFEQPVEKQFLFIAVMTTRKFLKTRASDIHVTWGSRVPGSILYFVGGSEAYTGDLPVVTMNDINDTLYPPQGKSFTMIEFISKTFTDRYEWFMRSDDDLYVRTDKLELYLRRLNSSMNWYIGQPGYGLLHERHKLGLVKPFCMGGVGIIFSKSVLVEVGKHLVPDCLNSTVSPHEDTELGRCVYKFTGLPCTTSPKLRLTFVHKKGRYTNHAIILGSLEKGAITIHPIKYHPHMLRIDSLYSDHKVRQLQQKMTDLQSEISNLDKSLKNKMESFVSPVNDVEILESDDNTLKNDKDVLDLDVVSTNDENEVLASDVRNTNDNNDVLDSDINTLKHNNEVLDSDDDTSNDNDEVVASFTSTNMKIKDYLKTGDLNKGVTVYESTEDFSDSHSMVKRSVEAVQSTSSSNSGAKIADLSKFIDNEIGYEWDYFDKNLVLNTRRGEYHSSKMYRFTRILFRYKIATEFKIKYGSKLELKSLPFAYSRFKSGTNMEFILQNKDAKNKKYLIKTIQTFSGIQFRELLPLPHPEIWIILPLSERSEEYRRFLEMLVQAVEKNGKLINLKVVLYRDSGGQFRLTQMISNDFRKSSKYLSIWTVLINGTFSRGRAISKGIEQLPSNSLLIFMDVDMYFDESFLHRAVLNTIRGKQVWFPICFSQFNPIIACYGKEHCSTESNHGDDFGLWRDYGFGIASMYKQDLFQVGGFNLKIVGWGSEDLELYEKKSHLQVFRTEDPSLIHVYHEKSCNRDELGNKFWDCLRSQLTLYGSVNTLSTFLTDFNVIKV